MFLWPVSNLKIKGYIFIKSFTTVINKKRKPRPVNFYISVIRIVFETETSNDSKHATFINKRQFLKTQENKILTELLGV